MLSNNNFLNIYGLIYLFSLFFSTVGLGQHAWERVYGDSIGECASEVEQTKDGGYIILGNNHDKITRNHNIYLVKTTANGDTLWTRTYDKTAYDSGNSIEQTTDGGYLIFGKRQVETGYNQFDSRMYLIKTNSTGDTLWTHTYASFTSRSSDEEGFSIQQTRDGGFILLGGSVDICLLKIDSLGTVLWKKKYSKDKMAWVTGGVVQETRDGGYIVSISCFVWSTLQKNDELGMLYKLDVNGNEVWNRTYDPSKKTKLYDVKETSDGGFIVARSTLFLRTYSPDINQGIIDKLDANGHFIWSKNTIGIPRSLDLTRDGGFICTGSVEGGGSDYQLFIQKLDASGNSLLERIYGGAGRDVGSSIRAVTNGGFIVAGETTSYGNGDFDLYVILVDSAGIYLTGTIQGDVFQDLDLNCISTTGDIDLEGIVVQASLNNTNLTYYGTTDSLGHYEIPCQWGRYSVTIPQLHPYYSFHCPQNILMDTVGFNDTVNFPLEATILCPVMHVDASVSILRKTAPSTYVVQYCNQGTVDGQNVSIEVDIDPFLTVHSFSIPPISQVGNTYTFNIGTVRIGECGTIDVEVQVDSSAILGQTHCVEVHISPDSLCLPHSWTGMILDVEGACQNDSVFFRIQNLSTTSTLTPRNYWVFEDDIIMRIGTVNVPNGGDTIISISAAPRKFYRIEVEQEAGIPWVVADSIASAFVEGCVPDDNGEFNVHFPNLYPNGHAPTFMAIDCHENGGAFDPNNKIAQPVGYASNHYIKMNQYIDYQINFQNTGTDTAFQVILIDTLSTYLDVSSIQMTTASHPYTWQVKDNGVLEVLFENIMLPDSFVNEAASHGFVKFRIWQKENNPIGTVIYNFADIYFDQNAPIRTNTTHHEIGVNFYTITIDPPTIESETIVRAFPNPFTDGVTIQVEGKKYQALTLMVYDLMGHEVAAVFDYNTNTIRLKRNRLNTGVYLFKLVGEGKPICSGKIVAQ